MGKTKSIGDLVSDLQRENESLQRLKKLFDKACKDEFGYDVRTIHAMLERQAAYESRKVTQQGSSEGR